MDLFDEVADPATDRPADEWDILDGEPPEAEAIPADELEAIFLGQDRAGIPTWSCPSAKRNADAFQALLLAAEEARRPRLIQAEAESYQGARRRKLALLAMTASQPPED